jgi:hypothetical protein
MDGGDQLTFSALAKEMMPSGFDTGSYVAIGTFRHGSDWRDTRATALLEIEEAAIFHENDESKVRYSNLLLKVNPMLLCRYFLRV